MATAYTPNNVYADKDALTANDPEKAISGADIDSELNEIATVLDTRIEEPSSPTSNQILYYDGVDWAARDPDARVQFLGELAPFGKLSISDGNTDEISLTCTEVQVYNASNAFIRATSISVTIDASQNGAANRLDTGTIATGWYYVWGISDGTNHDGLLSLSATAPTLPGSYTYRGLLGAVYYDTSDFVDIRQLNTMALRTEVQVVTNGVATTPTAMGLTTAVPPNATSVYGYVGFRDTAGGGGSNSVSLTPTSDTDLGRLFFGGTPDGSTFQYASFEMPLIEDQEAYYAAGSGGTVNVYVTGWRF